MQARLVYTVEGNPFETDVANAVATAESVACAPGEYLCSMLSRATVKITVELEQNVGDINYPSWVPII